MRPNRLPRPMVPPPGLMGPRGPGMGMRPPRGPPPMGPRGPRGPIPALGRPPLPGMVAPPRPGLPRPLVPMGVPGVPTVSSCTNANDPASKDSRLFVGNLNTIALSKEAVEGIFRQYGVVVGISMHKGYAFVQYAHPDEARRAGASEDGKHYAGQAIGKWRFVSVVSDLKSEKN